MEDIQYTELYAATCWRELGPKDHSKQQVRKEGDRTEPHNHADENKEDEDAHIKTHTFRDAGQEVQTRR